MSTRQKNKQGTMIKRFITATTIIAAVAAFLVVTTPWTGFAGGSEGKSKIDPDLIVKGKDLYAKSGCTACHGPEGKGDGPAGQGFPADKKPTDFTSGKWKFGGDDETVRLSIRDGRPPFMPPQKHLGEEAIEALSAFVRSLDPKVNGS